MDFIVDLMGPDAMLYPTATRCPAHDTRWTSSPQKAFLRVQANSIEGGTTQIMKNILGERVLGLPGDIRADKDSRGARSPATDPERA